MSDELLEFRDIHYTKSRYENQIKQFEIDASPENYQAWKIYEAWLIGHGRKLPTILKQLGAFKRTLKLFPNDDMKNISKPEIIQLNSVLVTSDYKVMKFRHAEEICAPQESGYCRGVQQNPG